MLWKQVYKMHKKILKSNLNYLIIFFFIVSCSSVPKYPNNACKIFGERYLWYKHVKKSSQIYDVPVHIILAFVNKESGFNRWARPKRTKLFKSGNCILEFDIKIRAKIIK